MPSFYTRYNLPPRIYFKSDLPSMVQPQFSFECDINNLVRTITDRNGVQRTVFTGVASSLPAGTDKPKYGDFSQYTSEKLLASMNIVAQARSHFEQLPSYLRERFSNDPTKLVAFVNDASNYDEALKLGLVNKRAEVVKDVATVQPTKPSEASVTPSGAT